MGDDILEFLSSTPLGPSAWLSCRSQLSQSKCASAPWEAWAGHAVFGAGSWSTICILSIGSRSPFAPPASTGFWRRKARHGGPMPGRGWKSSWSSRCQPNRVRAPGLGALRQRGTRDRGKDGSVKSAWQGFHVADGFLYICLSGLHWSACAAIFEKTQVLTLMRSFVIEGVQVSLVEGGR